MTKLGFYSFPVPMPFIYLKRFVPKAPLIVNYHIVSDNKLPHVENLYNYRDIKGFVEDLEFYRRYFQPIEMLEFIDHIQNKTKIPDNSLIITFDDGFREVFDIALPILLKKKITATAFLTSDFIDNKELGYPNKKSLLIGKIPTLSASNMNVLKELLINFNINPSNVKMAILKIPYRDRFILDEIAKLMGVDFREFLQNAKPYLSSLQIRELIKEGITIGSHSIDHANFSELSIEEQIMQATKSMDVIKETFNLNYHLFAFPYTDIGISKKFFDQVKDHFDATFGTQDLFQDTVKTNFQRVNIEKYTHSAKKTLKSHYLRYLLYSFMKKDKIARL